MKIEATEILLLIGVIVLTISFMFKWYQITTKKQTIEMSSKSWIIMLIGRMCWCIYGFMLGTIGGIFILVAQGLIAMMTIPILYYIKRNIKTNGLYYKSNFKRYLFFYRIFGDVAILTILCLFVTFTSYHSHWHYHISTIATFIVGTIGAAITAYALFPQAIRIQKTKNTESMSLLLQITFVIGNSILISYLIYQLSITENYMSYIGSIVFGAISIAVMTWILIYKAKNVIINKEKVH